MKWVKAFIFIEIQVALVMMGFLLTKQYELEEKVFNTNKFVFELLTDKRFEELKRIDNNDIVIGEEYAPVTLFVYARYGCSACRDFFENVYPRLRDEYVSNGELKIVIRLAANSSRPHALHASKAALFAYRKSCFDEFNNSLHLLDASISEKIVDNIVTNLIDCTQEEYNAFINDGKNSEILRLKAEGANNVGINRYPTFILGNEKFVGVRQFMRFQALIEDELRTESCR